MYMRASRCIAAPHDPKVLRVCPNDRLDCLPHDSSHAPRQSPWLLRQRVNMIYTAYNAILRFNNGVSIGDWGLDALLAVRMSKPW